MSFDPPQDLDYRQIGYTYVPQQDSIQKTHSKDQHMKKSAEQIAQGVFNEYFTDTLGTSVKAWLLIAVKEALAQEADQTKPPEGYTRCGKKNCQRWFLYFPNMVMLCNRCMGRPAETEGFRPDWTPPALPPSGYLKCTKKDCPRWYRTAMAGMQILPICNACWCGKYTGDDKIRLLDEKYGPDWTPPNEAASIDEAVAKAVQAERSRCAKIAEACERKNRENRDICAAEKDYKEASAHEQRRKAASDIGADIKADK